MKKTFLDEKCLLLEAVSEWLQGEIRVSETGAQSLDHLLVVTPTRQAGRRLRMALAGRLGGCIPPHIRQPAHLLKADETVREATVAELLAVVAKVVQGVDASDYPMLLPQSLDKKQQSFSWGLGIARQLQEVWHILAEGGLLMQDVAQQINAGELEAEVPVEEEQRWKSLALFEERVLEHLEQAELKHPAVARREAIGSPNLPTGVEQVVLPSLTDAQPAFYRALEAALRKEPQLEVAVLIHAPESEADLYDEWGRPQPERWRPEVAPAIEFAEESCIMAANSTELAAAAAGILAGAGSNEELPAIGLADEELFEHLQAALLTRKQELHNPAGMGLMNSSLGKIVAQALELIREPGYRAVAAWLRSADAWRFLQQRLGVGESDYALLLQNLDEVHQKHLPQNLDELHHFSGVEPEWQLLQRSIAVLQDLTAGSDGGLSGRLRYFLAELFKPRPLDEGRPEDRELAAAAAALDQVLQMFESAELAGLLSSKAEETELLEILLQQAIYSLEPVNPETILTDGWLELPWNESAELVICGMNEGSVPEAVVGHAFLPDKLRRALGLSDNERRAARDANLLLGLLRSRQQGAVTLLLERMNNRGDVRKPSRLLFMCGNDDSVLAARARRLYRDSDRPASGRVWTLPDEWRLRLPWPVSGEEAGPEGWPVASLPDRVGVTALSTYLQSPFSFYLRYVLKMSASDDRQREMDNLLFGKVMHEILQAFGNSDQSLRDSSDAGRIEERLTELLREKMHLRFGNDPALVLRLQEETLRQRLANFAVEHARLIAEGWRIVANEKKFVQTFEEITVSGIIDRIDHHPELGYRIIDYKTWEKKQGSEAVFFTKGTAVAQMEELGYPVFVLPESRKKPRKAVWRDLQLVLYRELWLTELAKEEQQQLPVECGYFVLGSSSNETGLELWSLEPYLPEAQATIQRVMAGIKSGLFWPPLELVREYRELFPDDLEKGIDPLWVEDQKRRLQAMGIAAGGEE